jgi:tetratricopeptide (TPR) repeat protein
VDRSPEEAYRWYKRAADQGLGSAEAAVARCCAKGIGVAKDPGQAMSWWNKAAAAEYPGAQFHLGLGYFSGAGIARDFERAVACFEKDARQHHVGAQLYLGLCFWRGDGVSRDQSQSEKWWSEACIQGIVPWRYSAGNEALGDEGEVEAWWRDVADQANASLQCCLAESYHFGHGVPADDSQAAAWYRKAAARGDLVALKRAAWLLATSSNPKVRDGAGAIEFGQKAVAATEGKDASIQDTLAAAYAEASQFDQAIRTEKRALDLARREDEKQEYQARLKLYEAHTPFRVTP